MICEEEVGLVTNKMIHLLLCFAVLLLLPVTQADESLCDAVCRTENLYYISRYTQELIDIDEIKHTLGEGNVSFVDFYSAQCAASQLAKPELEKAAKELYKQVAFYSVNVDRVPEALDYFFIPKIPRFIVYSGNAEIGRYFGKFESGSIATYVGAAWNAHRRKIAEPGITELRVGLVGHRYTSTIPE